MNKHHALDAQANDASFDGTIEKSRLGCSFTIIARPVAELHLPFVTEILFFFCIRLALSFDFRSKPIMPTLNVDDGECQKKALVIGNGTYSQPVNRLAHSSSNARSVAEKLKFLDFPVTVSCDLRSKEDMVTAFQDFTKGTSSVKLLLLYYSGHACHLDGNNYLLPVGDDNLSATDIVDSGYNVQQIIKRVHEENKSLKFIIILDCCYPYQFHDGTRAQSIQY